MAYHAPNGTLLYSNQQAADYTADKLNDAEEELRRYFRESGETDIQTLGVYWYEIIQKYFEEYDPANPTPIDTRPHKAQVGVDPFMPTLPTVKPFDPC